MVNCTSFYLFINGLFIQQYLKKTLAIKNWIAVLNLQFYSEYNKKIVKYYSTTTQKTLIAQMTQDPLNKVTEQKTQKSTNNIKTTEERCDNSKKQ